MEYFLGHFVYVLIAGLAIAGICAVWAFAAAKWHAEETPEEEAFTCSMGCPGCKMIRNCGRSKDGTPLT